MVRYDGIPKKRRVYVDEVGRQIPLNKLSGASHYLMVATSGTINGAGLLTVTGTQFKPDTVVTASYIKNATVNNSIGILLADGEVTFKGTASTPFYYIAVNITS